MYLRILSPQPPYFHHLFIFSLKLLDNTQLIMVIKGQPQDLIVAGTFVTTSVDGKKIYIMKFFTYITIN